MERKRKMLLALPLLVIPFLTLGFWAIGGGRKEKEKGTASGGLNLQLPGAKFKNEGLLDKLGFYEKAERDSAKWSDWLKADPSKSAPLEKMVGDFAPGLNASPFEKRAHSAEDQLLEKIGRLQQEINKPVSRPLKETDEEPVMETAVKEDPEISQLSTVMDKILDLQHPERVKQRMSEEELLKIESAYRVSGSNPADTGEPGFNGADYAKNLKPGNTIAAVVNETRTLVNNSIIALRLEQDIYVGEERISAGHFVYGKVRLNGERLDVEITTIRAEQQLFPVALEVYDLDGLPGISVPGSIAREVVTETADQGMASLDVNSMDPSLKSQARARGINAIRQLFSKKVKLVKVQVKAGYRVLLKDKKL